MRIKGSLAGILLLALASSASAAEPARVYTNEDLERMFGGTSEPQESESISETETAQPAQPAQQGNVDPLRALEAEKRAAAAQQVRIATAEKELVKAEETLKEMEKRLLALKNPYLPRPVVSPEEKEAWKGLDNVERVKRTKEQLEGVRQELERAKNRLEELRLGS